MGQSTTLHWRIAIDTGGTFTDCLARASSDSGGREEIVRRVKILSSAAMRGRIAGHDGRSVHIDAGWLQDVPSLRGFTFRAMGSQRFETVVRSHEQGDAALELRGAPEGAQLSGEAFEVASGETAPILAARIATRTPLDEPLPSMSLRLATTRGTNALLERAGARVAFIVNEGFADLLLIGDQQRPDIFALDIHKPPPLYDAVVEVAGRLNADGSLLQPLDLERVREEARRLVKEGITSAAIALMHSYLNDEHERAVERVLLESGFEYVARSASLAPLIEILPRAETAVVESYLAAIIEKYLSQVTQAISAKTDCRRSGATLHVMTSAGGLVRADQYLAKDSLLSGPAGGVAGAAAAGRASGFDCIIGFDMGGTSTDVARYDADFEYRFEHRVGPARLVAPALAIETVAAGGGSICGLRDGRLFVGPESAGADPGPACYGAGGPLTLTDVNLLLGRIGVELFEVPIDVQAAERALDDVACAVARWSDSRAERHAQQFEDSRVDPYELLDGFLAIANERMAGAIQQVSLRRGYDPSDYALVSFGGAGGQHACAIAAMLGMKTVIMPADASILSAVGLDHALIERIGQRQVLARLDELGDELARLFKECAEQVRREVMAEGIDAQSISIRRRIANMRLLGQDATVAVEVDDLHRLEDAFAQRYAEIYGHAPEGKPIEVESIRVIASQNPGTFARMRRSTDTPEQRQHRRPRRVRARFDGMWRDIPAYAREELAHGSTIDGPAIIFDRMSAYVIEIGWNAVIDDAGAIVARYHGGAKRSAQERDGLVQMELFAGRFASIAEEMGQILERTALSTNVKRRLDFSCAVLDAHGELIVNAPHIPVHLGALGLCVRSVADTIEMRPGDVLVTNHPKFGGSHLPDITVITPVFHENHLVGFVANRAHHAEIGGVRPGSMPPLAKRLIEEGVVIPPMHLVRAGVSNFEAVAQLLQAGPYPSRSVADNLADLRAAVAANQRGAAALLQLVEQFGRDEISRRMGAIKDHAVGMAQQALVAHGDGVYEADERLDDGSCIRVRMTINAGRLTIDFSGSAEQHPGNLNATPAIVRSAVVYVLRLLMGEQGRSAGLNEGIMRCVQIILPRGLLNPEFPGSTIDAHLHPAVVGGNVETSQRLVDTLIKALGLAACSQGTMNNVLFGNARFGYYETVCGGAGATPNASGASAVHTHMTNTRITDPELLEHRYPVRLERFAIRAGSGGAGRHRGGDGALREIVFLEPMSLSILSQHRAQQPYGGDGGSPGACGSQFVLRATGEKRPLASVDQCEVEPGDRLILNTPGGGGWGSRDSR